MNPRTCIGCRQRADATELVRFVADPESPSLIRPDPVRRLPGRGCYLHPRWDCYDSAVRRRAFARALRLSTSVDLAEVEQMLAGVRQERPDESMTASRLDGAR